MNTEARDWLFNVITDMGIATTTATMGFVTVGDGWAILTKPVVVLAIMAANFPVIKAARRSLPRRLDERVEIRSEAKANEKVQTLVGQVLQIPPDPRVP